MEKDNHNLKLHNHSLYTEHRLVLSKMKTKNHSTLMPWLILIVSVCGAFIFFQWWYPYHLFRREQTMLLLMDGEFISEYFTHAGWAGALIGDFLTQFFYYKGAGAAIIGIALGILWLVSWQSLRMYAKSKVLPMVLATAITAWEFMRECGDTYSLGSTISLIGAFALLCVLVRIKNSVANAVITAISIALCYWCFGYAAFILSVMVVGYAIIKRLWVTCATAILALIIMPKATLSEAKWWGSPNFALEHKLAIDSEAYFGNWEKVLNLALEGENTRYSSFYYYLINALMDNLPEAVLNRIPKDAEGLLPTMDPTKNSIDLSALGEVWYYLGDMTSAEHCTIVAMIASTHSTGSRFIRRLAEINLAKGDNEAAMKYLRLLSKTLCHSKWAASRMPGHESDAAKAKREDVSRFIVDTDTIRFVNDYTRTLRHLVNGHPDNNMAYDFLLCHDLLRCDIKSFINDYDPTRHTPRLYQEALLINLSINNATEEEVEKYNIYEKTFEDFYNFNQLMPITDANRQEVAKRFGNTYWYFYQIANQNESK